MTRALPEKTFEHWCSIHLTYRYKAKLRQWWPSSGADIAVETDPSRVKAVIGKRFWLELKVPEWDPASGNHLLKINLKQLIAYGNQSVPDYYVFPIPAWQGVLGEIDSDPWLAPLAADLSRDPSLLPLHRSDVAFQSHSADQWFARWTWVVSGKKLRAALATEIVKFTNGNRKKVVTVAKINPGTVAHTSRRPGRLTFARRVGGIKPILWHQFLRRMETCGDSDFPAQFVLPPGLQLPVSTNSHSPISRTELRDLLRELGQADGCVPLSGGKSLHQYEGQCC